MGCLDRELSDKGVALARVERMAMATHKLKELIVVDLTRACRIYRCEDLRHTRGIGFGQGEGGGEVEADGTPGRSWKVMEGHGRVWRAMEGRGG